jgi:hypothetical protein
VNNGANALYGNCWIETKNTGDQLAGPEDARQELWGSEVIKELDLKLLPKLQTDNLFCDGSDLDMLEQEILLVKAKADLIASRVRFDSWTILAIAKNILKAIQRAKAIDGGVVIW